MCKFCIQVSNTAGGCPSPAPAPGEGRGAQRPGRGSASIEKLMGVPAVGAGSVATAPAPRSRFRGADLERNGEIQLGQLFCERLKFFLDELAVDVYAGRKRAQLHQGLAFCKQRPPKCLNQKRRSKLATAQHKGRAFLRAADPQKLISCKRGRAKCVYKSTLSGGSGACTGLLLHIGWWCVVSEINGFGRG